MGLQRQFDRRRRISNGDEHPKILDDLNEILVRTGRVLHATKGFRTVSEKRDRAQMLMAEQRAGKFPFPLEFKNPLPILATMSKFIKTGLWK